MIRMAGALATVGATAVAAAQNPPRDLDQQEIANRLDAVSQDLQQINIRLDSISTVLINPPDPDRPAIRSALLSILDECGGIIVKADDMLQRV
jgi:hypothetical protein